MHFRWEGGTGRRRRKGVVDKEGVVVVVGVVSRDDGSRK